MKAKANAYLIETYESLIKVIFCTISTNLNVCNLSLKSEGCKVNHFSIYVQFNSSLRAFCYIIVISHLLVGDKLIFCPLSPSFECISRQHECIIVEMMLYNYANVFKLNVHCSKLLRRIFHSSSYFANNAQYEVYINIICSKFYMHEQNI